MADKIFLEALLNKIEVINKKEKANALNLPEDKQRDLLFMSAILVSTGTNKNGATFLGSELIKARKTIAQKALDIEHKEQEIIGHIVSAVYMDQDGNILDDENLYDELAKEVAAGDTQITAELDKRNMDIGIICAVYKDRFPDIAKEIEKGDWKISMECYYEDYDLKIGDLIITGHDKSKFKSIDDSINKDIKIVLSGSELGTQRVSRVLRAISFCGVGIVKNPANDRSVILEAASNNMRKVMEREGFFVQAELKPLELNNKDQFKRIKLPEDDITNEVVQVKSSGYFLLKDGAELVKDSFNFNYNEISKEAVRRAALDSNKHSYYIVATNSKFIPREKIELNDSSEAVTYNTDEIGNVVQVNAHSASERELSYTSTRYGPEDRPAGICISFEKYVREFPGHANPGRIVATHWCKLFNKPCPVLGASALDSACLRNKYSHMVKVDSTIQNDLIVPSSFNPAVPLDQTKLLTSDQLPSPKTEQEILSNKKLEGTPAPDSTVKDKSGPVMKGMPEKKGFSVPDAALVDNSIKVHNMKTPPGVVKITPIKDFPVKAAQATMKERKSLEDRQFALPAQRKYPINTKERFQTLVAIYPKISAKLTSSEKLELDANMITAGLVYGVDTSIENKSDNIEEYGVPRLKLFPLSSREQVIAAMSRFRHLKEDLTDNERKFLVVNILRAAKRHNIDADNFRSKVGYLLNSIYG